ncbi:endonuclease/exonuclease/phosphatase-like protein [Leptomonas seymouri]|uniref:Endonuclease/exonuclease/phosphatase-like protein n=1 Tax=Leptomonas seymouri TaxID=5684 RepID=A0A0N1IA74_LEPSE|nr:endonuclease/exonuclease/phosphatase-like protein [Leptomonas seymouri]|eukprot:KPI89143.1 endonuclease/exonuclease/phosphatase-like protein [Leptomonas seymouri]
MPGRIVQGCRSVHGHGAGGPTPNLRLVPLETPLVSADHTSTSLSNDHSDISLATDTPEMPTRRGSIEEDRTFSPLRSGHVTVLVGSDSTGLPADTFAGAAQGIGRVTPSSSSPGRSLTLLERRNNRECSMMSISSPSGLNVETLLASMLDTSMTPMEAQETKPLTHGWSKMVASAALLGDFEVPHIHSSMYLDECSNSNSNNNVPSATPCTSTMRKAPAATPGCQRAGAVLPRSAGLASGSGLESAMKSPGQLNTSAGTARKKLDSVPGAVKVASYNILASRLASTDLYPHCPPSVLSEEYRINLVKEEVWLVDPDILLMEEISVGVHEESLGPYLKSALGLEGHHAVITDSSGQPRCSTRPPTATSSTPPHKGPSSTRKKFGGISLAAFSGKGGARDTPLTLESPPRADRRPDENNFCASDSFAAAPASGGRGSSSLPPLMGTNMNLTHPPSRCDSCMLAETPAIGHKNSCFRPNRAQTSFSFMGATHTQLSTTNLMPATPSHGGVLQRSNSGLEVRPFAAAAVEATASDGALRCLQKKCTPELLPSAAPVMSPDASAANACTENHRRIEMDGVAIYYRASRFRVLEVVPVQFNALAAAENRLTLYEHQKLQVNSHNVALITVLHDTQAQGAQHVYIVAAVHFIWQRTNAQLWQAHQLLRTVEELKSRYSRGDADLVAAAALRCSMGVDNLPTQPPSQAETPLYREMGGWPCVRRELPLPSTPARRQSIPQRVTAAASDSTIESISTTNVSCIGNSNANAPAGPIDRLLWRRESVVSTSTTAGGVLVTCVIGGDFNSERSGPVMEYLRTGRVPEGVPIMNYWKASTQSTPCCRQSMNAETEKGAHTALGSSDKKGGGKGEKQPSPSPLNPSATAAYIPHKRPTNMCAPRRDNGALPHQNSPTSSISSQQSPAPPSVQGRRRTHSPSGAFVTDCAASPDATGGSFLLQRNTPLRQRPSPRLSGGVRRVESASMQSAAGTPGKDTSDVPNSASARVVGATPVAPITAEGSPSSQRCLNNFCFERSSTSLMSPFSSILLGVTERSADEISSTPPARGVKATASTARTPACNQEGQSPILHNSRRHKTIKLASHSNNGQRCSSTKGPASPRLRQHASPEASRSIGSSALIDLAQDSKFSSDSHSVSECGSVLSTPFGEVGCSMKFPLHSCNDAPRRQSSDAGWMSEEEKGEQQPPPPLTPPHHNTCARGRTRKSAPNCKISPLNALADNDDLVTPGKADGCAKLLPTSPPAASSSHGDGENVFGSLIHPQLSQMDNFEAPPAPKAGAKGRPISSASTNILYGSSKNGRRNSAAPASPQALRLRPLDAAVGTCSTPFNTCAQHQCSLMEELQLSPLSSASASSHGVPWPSSLKGISPCKPAKGLLNEVAHAIRFSDAYAPYCYRHPSRVSAVNPSTSMEGKVLDHILYEDEHVVCGAVLRLGERQELPNARVPSDHYMIGAVLVPIQELRRS